MFQDYKKVVVSRTDRIGDVVLSLPVFATIKKCIPGITTYALVSDYALDVAGSSPFIDGVVGCAPRESVFSMYKKLRAIDADAIIVLFPRFRIALASILAGMPLRIGTAYRWYSFLFNCRVHEHRKESLKSEAEYNLSLVRPLGCTEDYLDVRLLVNEESSGYVQEFLDDNCLSRFAVVHPGSGGSAHDWSAENFRSVVKFVSENLGMDVIITGTQNEQAICRRVSEGISNAVNSAGRFSILQLIALISKARVFISNSTGPLHLAASVGTPVVGIYPNRNPMTPVRWAPITLKKIILTPDDGSDEVSRVTIKRVCESVESIIARFPK